jgi:hypothetical protein
MQKWATSNIEKISSPFVSILVVLDGFSMLYFGIIHSFMIGVIDPIPVGPGADKRILMFYAEIVVRLTFVYFIACLVALIVWLSRWRFRRYVILGLGLLAVVGSSYFLIVYKELGSNYKFASYPFWTSLAINIPLIAFIILDTVKPELVRHENNA